MTPDRATKWAETRRHGRWTFIWRTGLAWGGTMFGIFFGMQVAQNPGRWLLLLAVNAVIWLFAGFFFGVTVWYTTERSYARHLSKQSATGGGAL